MFLEKALHLLQAPQEHLSTNQNAFSSQDVTLDESQLDRVTQTVRDSAMDFVLLNLVFVHISLRDWFRALRVAQRLLLSSSAQETIM
jgi:hypothetical protein